jgi:hypothetical protein
LRYLQTLRDDFQPSNVTWAMVAPLTSGRLPKRERYEAMAARALEHLAPWVSRVRSGVAGTPIASALAAGSPPVESVCDAGPRVD